ncbi:MAG: hypothetical protein GXP22_01475 [Gammaproteobacteria bacterium]|nr:hypothetical protein [Gammaproteobacteria bacterium]
MRSYLKSLVETILAIAGVIAFVNWYVTNQVPNLEESGVLAVLIIGVLLFYYLAAYLFLRVRWGRNKKYAETIKDMSNGFSAIHALNRRNLSTTTEKYAFTHSAIIELCNNLAHTMNVITSARCHVSIKVLILDTDNLFNERYKATTFCRSTDSARGNNDKNENVKHWVEENTDFLAIFEEIENGAAPYFKENNIPFRYGYKNSSFAAYGQVEGSGFFSRLFLWKPPYKSTMVVPICPYQASNKKELLGFVCVDSPKRFVFKEDYDLDLLRGVSDGLYNIIKELWVEDTKPPQVVVAEVEVQD